MEEEDIQEETGEQNKSSKKAEWLRPWHFKKGVSGNPSGKPKGTLSLKEYARIYLKSMTDEEKEEFMEGLPKEVIWKMSEGNPKETADIKTDKTIENLTDEELELANKILNERRSKTTSIESEGSVSLSVDGEVRN